MVNPSDMEINGNVCISFIAEISLPDGIIAPCQYDSA